MIAAILLVIFLLVIAATITFKVTESNRSRQGVDGPPARPGWISRAGPDAGPDQPVFIIHKPEFTIEARPGSQPARPARNGFEPIGITQNMTAICRLTGRPAGECGCDRHRGAGPGTRAGRQ